MDSKIYKQIKEEYAEKRRKAQQTADERRFEVYSKAPEVKEKLCTKCGSVVKGKFCAKCGTKVE